MSKKKIIVFIVLAFTLVGLLVGCNSLNYNKVKRSIFTDGDYVCLPNEDGTITILELSEQGKGKEVLIIPETIKGQKVVSLGGRVYGGSLTEKEKNRLHVFSSERLKKMYLLFQLEDQYLLYDSDREFCEYIIDIPNAVVVGLGSSATTLANDGYNCKGVVLVQENIEMLQESGYDLEKFLPANVIYRKDSQETGKKYDLLWADYVDATTPIGYQPSFADQSGKEPVAWMSEEEEGMKNWDGIIKPGVDVVARYGDSDGKYWGQESMFGSFYIGGLVPGASASKTLSIPAKINGKTVKGIASDAFRELSFKEVILPDSVEIIDFRAFMGCRMLTKITFGEDSKCQTIYRDAFKDCTSLTSFIAGNGLRNIYSAFTGCTALTTVDLNNCGGQVLDAFRGCTSLTSFTKNENNTELDIVDGVSLYDARGVLLALAGGADVIDYQLKDSCSGIEGYALYGNTKVKSVTCAGYMFCIFESCFEGCTALESVDLTVATLVSTRVFYGCENLTSIRLTVGSGTYFDNDCFAGTTESCTIYVPAESVSFLQQNAERLGIRGSVQALE